MIVAVGLLQLGGRDPDVSAGGNRLASLVEHLARVLVRLETRQRQPQLSPQTSTRLYTSYVRA